MGVKVCGMHLHTWLKQETGRAAEMARHFSVTESAVNYWANQGVPVRRMKAVREYTANAVTLDEMVPEPESAVGDPEC